MNKFLQLWNKYERPLAIFTFVGGFSFDLIISKRPDSIFANILLLFYLTVCALIIVLLNRRSNREMQSDEQPVEPLFQLLVLQFCFGGLANNLLILYGKSGSFGGSLIFLALLVALIVGNEFLKNRYQQLRFNVAVYYVLLLTYIVIALPTFVFHSIGTREFLISGLVSLAVMALVVWMLRIFALRSNRKRQLWEIRALVVGIFLIFNGLYFLNLIPPVPLSLKAAGIYHSVTMNDAGDYVSTYEPKQWYEFWRDTSDDYTAAPGEPAYCFSAVFAPGDLATPIVHTWDYYDAALGKWTTKGRVQFPITGGRADGYRGFSEKRVLAEGQWKCTVSTASGQTIGSIAFTVHISSSTPALSTTTL